MLRNASLVLLVLLLSISEQARADIATVDSLAWRVDAAPTVVEATVTAAEQRLGREFVLTLQVHQRLKSSAPERITVAASSGRLLNSRGIFFMTPLRKVSTTDCYGVHHKMPWVGGALTGDPAKWVVPSRSFGLHRGYDAVIAAIRARRPEPPVTRFVAVPVPADTSFARWHGTPLGGLVLRIPADRETERWLLAQAMGSDRDRRIQAIMMLEPFESVPNIRLLLSLLDDETIHVDADGRTHYPVRHVARHTLEAWDVPLPEGPPTVVEPSP